MSESVYHLLYSSLRAKNVGTKELKDILESSRNNNRIKNLSGILLHRSGLFVQLLEGPEEAVKELYKKICKDQRHSDSRILMEFKSDKKILPIWNMGFIEESQFASDNDKLVENIEVLIAEPAENREIVLNVLKSFSTTESAETAVPAE